MSEAAVPSPERFFETMTSYQRSAALKAGIELDLFTAIADGARTAAEIADRCGGAVRATRMLLDFLTISGLLIKSRGLYGLTRESAAFLNRKSPTYMGGTAGFILAPAMVRNFDNLADIVRRGRIEPQADTMADDHPLWVAFAKAMTPMMIPAAHAIAEMIALPADLPSRVLDVAAGHGTFGITIARRYRHAVIEAVDWAPVLDVAMEHAVASGVADRYHLHPGDAFKIDFGPGFDAAAVTNFLHHFDRETCTEFLRKVAAALKPGGRVAILEFVPNEDRVSPPAPAAFVLNMLAGTQSGDAYTLPELSAMLETAGFGEIKTRSLPTPHTVIVATHLGGVRL